MPDRPLLRSPAAESRLSTVAGIKERDRIKLNLSSDVTRAERIASYFVHIPALPHIVRLLLEEALKD